LVLCCHVMMPNFAMIRGLTPFGQGIGREAFLWTFANLFVCVLLYLRKEVYMPIIYILKCQDHDAKLGLF